LSQPIDIETGDDDNEYAAALEEFGNIGTIDMVSHYLHCY
jgi:hypothetical protein